MGRKYEESRVDEKKLEDKRRINMIGRKGRKNRQMRRRRRRRGREK